MKTECEMKKLSVVIPCYRSEKTIGSVVNEVRNTIKQRDGIRYQIILVDDNSPDGVYDVIRKLCADDNAMVGVKLSRNFGQQSALLAGQSLADGDIIVCLDDDGQSPADRLYDLTDKLEQGFDVVFAKYSKKKQTFFRRFGSWMNLKMAEILLDKPKGIDLSSFFAIRKYVNDEMIKYTNPFPYNAGLIFSITRKISNVDCEHRNRITGKTGYTFLKLLGIWLNGFTAFSIKPLRFVSFFGFITAFMGFGYGIYIVLRKILDVHYVLIGWSSLMAIHLFLSGTIMFMLGFTGEYISRIYTSINKTPQYVIREILRNDR